MAKPPPITPAAPQRRRSVPVAVLLAVILGGFLWGLAMFAGGRASAAPGERGDAAAGALGQLNRLDQVIAGGDPAAARAQLAGLALPAGPDWERAVALRRAVIAELERQVRLRAAEHEARLRVDRLLSPLAGPGLGLVALVARPDQADELLGLAASRPGGAAQPLRSRDGGRHWTADARLAHDAERVPPPLGLLCVPGAPELVLVTDGAKDRRLGWLSRDGGAGFAEIPRPPKAGEPDVADHLLVGGDGVLVAVLPDAAGGHAGWSCFASRDGGRQWQAGARVAQLLLAAPTGTGAVLVGRDESRRVQVSLDAGTTFAEAEPALAAFCAGLDGEPACFPLGAGLCVRGADGAWGLVGADGRLAGAPPAIPAGRVAALAVHPAMPARWYLLGARGLLRSDDGGRSWRRGRGRLGELDGTCLAFAGDAAHAALLVGGDRLWSLDDADESLWEAASP